MPSFRCRWTVSRPVQRPGAPCSVYRAMIEASAAKRVGTTEEIASAAAYLLRPDAGSVTGSDPLIDGGVIAALRAGRLK
jgi:NAD(P)-dependent dehydrogenase (short-subunit alcohol dehydrogenase family)